MIKAFFYLFVFSFYLILSKTLSPDNSGLEYIKRSKDLNKYIKRYPSEVILLETLTKGFLIKTYYQRFKLVTPYNSPVEMIFRSRRSFAENNKKYKGMSVFRKKSTNEYESLPMPPGTLFIGNQQYGRWRFKEGEQKWTFYNAYALLPRFFNWKDFRPSKKLYKKILSYKAKNIPYTGNEFKEKNIKSNEKKIKVRNKYPFRGLLTQYLKTNYN